MKTFNNNDLIKIKILDESMLNEGIKKNDIGLISKLNLNIDNFTFNINDIYAVLINEHIILRHITKENNQLKLIPANSDYSVKVLPTDKVKIIGKLIEITRKYNHE